MHSEIPKLLQLQERDQRILALQKDLRDVPKLEAVANHKLSSDNARVEEAQNRMRDIELKLKTLELDAKTRQNTLERLATQQFETRKNEEFQALGHEIKRYEGEVRQLEDRQLELMEELEQAKSALQDARTKREVTQGTVNQELQVVAQRAESLRTRLADLEAERAGLVGPIEASALDLYRRIFKKKNDSAVVALEHGICGGCHMKVVSGTIQRAREGSNLAQCDSCGRLLYFVS